MLYEEHQEIELCIQQFCECGHSFVQEVDNLHSKMEKYFKHLDIYGPVSLVRYMPNVNIDRPFIVIQMRNNHFFDYQAMAKQYTNSDSKIP